jgi:hypothetical protein
MGCVFGAPSNPLHVRGKGREHAAPVQKVDAQDQPPSSRRNVGPCQHHALKNTELDVVVDGLEDLAIALEHGQHWGGEERSFGHRDHDQ